MSDWYTNVRSNELLQQGDIIPSCPIIVPQSISIKDEGGVIPSEIIEYDVVVLSQSCDLVQKKVNLVLVCPLWKLDEFSKKQDFFASDDGKEALRRGYVPGNHLLNKCGLGEYSDSYLVVDFRNVYSVKIEILTKLIKKIDNRIRVLPPYREHLSQAFARFFMRVGLPTDIPRFSKKPDLDIP